MSKTTINSDVNATVINNEVSVATVVNYDLANDKIDIQQGFLLAGKYQIVKPLGKTSGEADLYLCQYDGKDFVAKFYRRQHAVKPEVIAVLKSINSPYVASLVETGEHNGLPYEVLPYYKNGSLQGKKFTLQQLKTMVIPCINEALNVLHQHDVIHKDLKPSNVMLSDDEKSVALIDFGISSVAEGNTVLVTKTGMTPEYSAPETFRNLFLEESDYYSFGITLYELYCGNTPYKQMTAEEIAQFTAVQRIPFPDSMPQELVDLISAVTYFDITNRNNLDNPNRRWTYDEVANWLKGKKQVIPGEGMGFATDKGIAPYTFLNNVYTDFCALVKALATNWKDGKKQLYRGLLSAFFKNRNPKVAQYCLDAEDEASKTSGKDDVIFFKLLYQIYPDLKGFYWMGQTHENLPALGRDMLERLWKGDNSQTSYWDSILEKNVLSNYLDSLKVDNDDLKTAVVAIEASHAVAQNKRDKEKNYFLLAYLTSGQKLFAIGDKRLKSVAELTAYMKKLLDKSYQSLEDFCHSLINYDDTLDVQLEAWLLSLGKSNELAAWRQTLKG